MKIRAALFSLCVATLLCAAPKAALAQAPFYSDPYRGSTSAISIDDLLAQHWNDWTGIWNFEFSLLDTDAVYRKSPNNLFVRLEKVSEGDLTRCLDHFFSIGGWPQRLYDVYKITKNPNALNPLLYDYLVLAHLPSPSASTAKQSGNIQFLKLTANELLSRNSSSAVQQTAGPQNPMAVLTFSELIKNGRCISSQGENAVFLFSPISLIEQSGGNSHWNHEHPTVRTMMGTFIPGFNFDGGVSGPTVDLRVIGSLATQSVAQALQSNMNNGDGLGGAWALRSEDYPETSYYLFSDKNRGSTKCVDEYLGEKGEQEIGETHQLTLFGSSDSGFQNVLSAEDLRHWFEVTGQYPLEVREFFGRSDDSGSFFISSTANGSETFLNFVAWGDHCEKLSERRRRITFVDSKSQFAPFEAYPWARPTFVLSDDIEDAPYNVDQFFIPLTTGDLNAIAARGEIPFFKNLTPGQSQREAVAFSMGPNPFSDVLSIRMASLTKVRGSLNIYDVAGRRVQELFHNLEFNAYQGHLYHWDGKDLNGRMLPNGVYFVRFEAENGYVFGKQKIVLKR